MKQERGLVHWIHARPLEISFVQTIRRRLYGGEITKDEIRSMRWMCIVYTQIYCIGPGSYTTYAVYLCYPLPGDILIQRSALRFNMAVMPKFETQKAKPMKPNTIESKTSTKKPFLIVKECAQSNGCRNTIPADSSDEYRRKAQQDHKLSPEAAKESRKMEKASEVAKKQGIRKGGKDDGKKGGCHADFGEEGEDLDAVTKDESEGNTKGNTAFESLLLTGPRSHGAPWYPC